MDALGHHGGAARVVAFGRHSQYHAPRRSPTLAPADQDPTMKKVVEIRKLYYGTTAATITRDLARAIDLLKSMDTEEEREKVAVYMDGLSQMRSEWAQAAAKRPARR